MSYWSSTQARFSLSTVLFLSQIDALGCPVAPWRLLENV